MTDFALQIPARIEGQLRKSKKTIRDSVKERLREIARTSASPSEIGAAPAIVGPPLRFYVFDGYRISYELDLASHRVVVLDVQCVPG